MSASAAPLRGPWQHLAAGDFARLDPAHCVAVLPVSATEQHGPHLPLGTDALINAGVLEAAMARLPPSASVLTLPALEVGDSLEHTSFRGTLCAPADSLLGLWVAVGEAVARAGLRKLVIFNSHGGQKAHVDLAAVRLRAHHGLLVVRAHSFALGQPPGLFDADELAHGLHGGAVETSLMLHLHPELVRQGAVENFEPRGRALAARRGMLGVEKPVGLGWMAEDLHPLGVCGDARQARADKGRQLVEHMADALVRLFAEVADLEWPPAASGGDP